MNSTIPEKDWKTFRDMKKLLLQNQCQKALERIRRILDRPTQDAHATYLEIFKAIEKEDKIIASMFDDHRRSTAFISILSMVQHGLLSKNDLQRFTPETQERIEALSEALQLERPKGK